ncbi:MAG: universal stress protein, partial [Pseudomonadota bacterium]
MVKGKRIVAVVDSRLGADQTSMRRANWLAQQQQAGIELLLCLGDEHLSGEVYEDTTTLEKARERTTAHHQHQLKQLALDFGNQDIDVMTTVVWDTPLDDAITRHVLNSEPSLVIKETQHPSRVSQAFLSDTDWGLIGKCPAPLLLAKSNGWTMGAPVMAAIDPMFASHRTAMMDTEILCTAKKYAHISGSDMFAMHCFSPSYHGLAMPSYAYDGYQQRRRSLEAVHRESVVSFMSTHG